MEQITVVIGDRLGKGQKVAAGAEKAGARAVVVPGVAADMCSAAIFFAPKRDKFCTARRCQKDTFCTVQK